jgi:hypothetical protein
MISYKQALEAVSCQLANKPICDASGRIIDQRVIVEQHTRVVPYGWVFSYQSERHLRGEEEARLIGNSPILVTKLDGALHYIGTSGPIEDLLKAWEKTEGAAYL